MLILGLAGARICIALRTISVPGTPGPDAGHSSSEAHLVSRACGSKVRSRSRVKLFLSRVCNGVIHISVSVDKYLIVVIHGSTVVPPLTKSQDIELSMFQSDSHGLIALDSHLGFGYCVSLSRNLE